MITKTRSSETVKIEVTEERRFGWARYGQIVFQIIFTLSALYAAHLTYIHIWRIATGH
jgi:hypothetical protein